MVKSFRKSSKEEFTYSALVERICRKMTIDPSRRRLNLNVFVYLTSVDKDQRRSILHVESIMEGKKVSITEQLSRTEKASSYGGNFSEISSGVPKVQEKVENKDKICWSSR
ncbi:hypothetical protein N665_0051s0022 [Sinapis alba]|nr:hypothetical protein N665_0051s0022 [Sinapis alba]